jgi:AraC-like DNA-binding protein
LGVTPEELIRDREVLRLIESDPDAQIDARHALGVWEALAARSGRPDVALVAASLTSDEDLGIVGYVATRAPTLGDALRLHCQYFSLLVGFLSFELDVGPETSELRSRYRLSPSGVAPSRFAAEANLAVAMHTLRTGGPTGFELVGVRFTHPPPADPEPFSRFFGCSIAWRAPTDALRFATRWTTMPMRHADSAVSRFLAALAAERVATLPDTESTSQRVRRVVLNAPRDASAALVARKLGLSTRSLQRQLAAEGVRFRDVADEARAEVARRLLMDGSAGLSAIGLLLGFADASAFHRAFLRWEGKPPGQFRKDFRARTPHARPEDRADTRRSARRNET